MQLSGSQHFLWHYFAKESTKENVLILSINLAEGLMKERRGRACSAGGTGKVRPPKLDKKAEEDLIAENQRLRMELSA